MSLPLPELLRAVAQHGCTMRLEGETVRMRGSTPLPEPILADLRARKAEVIDFLSRRNSRQVPDEWRDGVRRLDVMPPALDWPVPSWERLKTALPGFLAAWAPQATALGWDTLDLFGCHPQAPYARLDQQGLALGLYDFDVVAMSERSAAIASGRDRTGQRMRYYRRPAEVLNGAVPIWSIGS